VIVTGKSKALKPTFQEQICLIAREALLNAFRHSEATTIEVELEYRARSLSLAIRDNGRGMDPQEVRTRRDSHWGLLGMEERAKTLGAQLHIWSRRGSGTEVEVALPINSASQGHQLALGHQ
jgi:signal transduction histidine kinase